MKRNKYLQFLVFTTLNVIVISCLTEKRENHQSTTKDSEATNVNENAVMSDSIKLAAALDSAFKIAKPQFARDSFLTAFVFYPGDSTYDIRLELEIGHIFGDEGKYFLLRRTLPFATFLNVYQLKEGDAIEAISHEQGGMTYIEDSIADVNGDGFKDFLVHWYPASGCCRRDIFSVYLMIPQQDRFSGEYEFLNPTFSPEEQIVRGVGYDHPGEVGLYKYKWNGFDLDTVEYIYPDADDRERFTRTKRPLYKSRPEDKLVIKQVPSEFLTITSYDWFSDY